MGARAAIVWIATFAVAFGLGWWAARPPALDAEDMASALERALEEQNPLTRAGLMGRIGAGHPRGQAKWPPSARHAAIDQRRGR